MAEVEVDRLNELLWKRMSAFWARHHTSRDLYDSVIYNLAAKGRTAALFGGALRDLMAAGMDAEPRDLDLVLDSQFDDDLTSVPVENQLNRFGGRRLIAGKCEVDLWPLARTWAFQTLSIGSRDFEDLPRTTFLNVEALAVRFDSKPLRRLGPWDTLFFHGFLDRTVEINLEINPNPLGCVIRSLVTTKRLGFAMGPKLVSFIYRHTRGVDLEELVDFQVFHYGHIIMHLGELAEIRSAVRDHMRTRRLAPFKTFTELSQQPRSS